MPALQPLATEPVYMTDAAGVRRLVAAVGDVIPTTMPDLGVITTGDPASAGIEPLDGYDLLSEAEVVELLPGLSDEDLAAMQAYEKAHKARGAVTRYKRRSQVVAPRNPEPGSDTPVPPPIHDVPAESTSEGYDSMGQVDLQAEVDKRELTVRGTGAKGKVLKKDLVAALQADDATK